MSLIDGTCPAAAVPISSTGAATLPCCGGRYMSSARTVRDEPAWDGASGSSVYAGARVVAASGGTRGSAWSTSPGPARACAEAGALMGRPFSGRGPVSRRRRRRTLPPSALSCGGTRWREPGFLSGPRRFGAASYVHGVASSTPVAARRLQLWQTGLAPSHRILRVRLRGGVTDRVRGGRACFAKGGAHHWTHAT